MNRPASPHDHQYDEIDALLNDAPKTGHWLVCATIAYLKQVQALRQEVLDIQRQLGPQPMEHGDDV